MKGMPRQAAPGGHLLQYAFDIREVNTSLKTMGELTSMGALPAVPCVEDKEESCLSAVVASLDENFPSDWRDWKVYSYTFEDLFGGNQVPPAIEAKLRFAIPTVDLARAFNPSTTSLSERSYRAIRMTILKWPLGRALLYAPQNLMEKIHSPSYDSFMNTVRELKPKLTKRREASLELEHLSPQTEMRSPSTAMKRSMEIPVEVHHSEAKRKAYANVLSSPARSQFHVAPTQGSSEHLLASVLSQQMLLFNKMLSLQTEQNKNIKTIIQNQQQRVASENPSPLKTSLISHMTLPDSTQSVEEKDDQLHGSETSPHWSDTCKTKEDNLRRKIAEAQRELASLTGDKNIGPTAFDFTPSTMEQEPKVARADPMAIKHGLSCQRLGESSWCNVRYADVQKQFQATPVFTSLKPNNLLAEITPNWKSVEILEKSDLTLGATTNGLIQQRMIFQKLLDSLPIDIKNVVGRDFVAANSEFRKNSDALLQYVCGRRAEVIKQRREVYKPTNKVLRGTLHDIPPSGTHLFEEKSLTEVVKELGGMHKLFPIKKKPYTNKKPIPQGAKPKTSQPGHHRFRDSRNATKRDPPYKRGA
ncbi:uncharacterized protein LOC123880520 [Maniola jurtina]|uniref:uncharacterized protein LOC123880520 n=1 Tax=Maniola jurtina TaxID=191418 RepID=UPI001E68C470|nr:uncharacterized protein LOC123880520 [Maniola jurtina]